MLEKVIDFFKIRRKTAIIGGDVVKNVVWSVTIGLVCKGELKIKVEKENERWKAKEKGDFFSRKSF